jgi:hypothetical protein
MLPIISIIPGAPTTLPVILKSEPFTSTLKYFQNPENKKDKKSGNGNDDGIVPLLSAFTVPENAGIAVITIAITTIIPNILLPFIFILLLLELCRESRSPPEYAHPPNFHQKIHVHTSRSEVWRGM